MPRRCLMLPVLPNPSEYPMEPVARRMPYKWRPQKISKAMRAVGVTHESLAAQLGRSRSVVSQVVGGRIKSAAVASAVASVLGLHPHDIWPRLYPPPSGEPTTAPMPALAS